MGKPAYAMDQKNPVMMDKPMKMKDLSGDGKITKKDVLIGRGVIDPPAKMYKDKPMKKYVSDAQRRAVHATKADGGAGNPNKMYDKKKK